MNRLAGEASPYLLQHARNPVDWWPWCAEALAEAKANDKPILLSIGYSACHWCHVMERESFDDPAIAASMNERFVCIKVDREERPDLDQIYQLTVQLMGRSGGWPLTVFLTPEQRPFFAGTYFPPVDKYGMPGFPKILEAVAEAYRERREEVDAQAAELTKAIAEVGTADDARPYAPGLDLLDRVVGPLLRRFDETHGGFGRAPKFPNTMPLEVLLRSGDGVARDMVRLALDAMRRGGIWDHLGGGFHRYSTDERWHVPHFEKMLYDNALLLRAYVDGVRVFRDEAFATTARGIAEYVLREMTDPRGGYYASQDADSEGEEGKFFRWDPSTVRALGGEAASLYFGEDEVLCEARPPSAVAAKLGITEAEARAAIDRARRVLLEEREKRPKPFRDEKVLTSWTALMAGAMAEAGVVLDEPRYVASAESALSRIESELLVEGGRVQRLVMGGRVKGPGFLDDHAYALNAFLDVYEATGEPSRVSRARSIADAMLAAFHSDEEGFFFTPRDGEALITRAKDPFDNAVPSGFSMACRGLLRLGALVGGGYGSIAEHDLVRLAPAAVSNPFAYGQSLCELDRVVRGSVDVVLVGARTDSRTRALARVVQSSFLPNRTLAWLDPTDPSSVAACAALAEGKPPSSSPSAYVCRGRTCSLPVTDPAALPPLLA